MHFLGAVYSLKGDAVLDRLRSHGDEESDDKVEEKEEKKEESDSDTDEDEDDCEICYADVDERKERGDKNPEIMLVAHLSARTATYGQADLNAMIPVPTWKPFSSSLAIRQVGHELWTQILCTMLDKSA